MVDVPEDTQIERTMKRDDNDADQVKNIIKTQTSREKRLEAASDVIENTQGLDYLDLCVSQLHESYIAFANEKNLKENV